MSIFNKLKGLKSLKNKEQNEIAKKIDSKHVAYAVSRDENGRESVLGKNGSINIIKNDQWDEIVVLCDGKYVFKADLSKCKIGELMSGNGVLIRGYNTITQKDDNVTAHYTYYRK